MCRTDPLIVSLSVNEEAEKQLNNSFVKLIDIHLLFMNKCGLQEEGSMCCILKVHILLFYSLLQLKDPFPNHWHRLFNCELQWQH